MGITRAPIKFKRIARDHYPTCEPAVDALFDVARFAKRICDPCCGPKRQILAAAISHHHSIVSPISDIVYGFDFVTAKIPSRWGEFDIISNPPYGNRQATLAMAFIERALEVVHPWKGRVAMLLPADFDSGNSRRHVFGDHSAFATTVVLLNRVRIFKNRSGTTNHRWFIWDWKKKPGPPITLYSHISYGD